MGRPAKIASSFDLAEVIRMFEDIHDDIESGLWHEDNDDKVYIYEAVAEAIYGKDYWKWFNRASEESNAKVCK